MYGFRRFLNFDGVHRINIDWIMKKFFHPRHPRTIADDLRGKFFQFWKSVTEQNGIVRIFEPHFLASKS